MAVKASESVKEKGGVSYKNSDSILNTPSQKSSEAKPPQKRGWKRPDLALKNDVPRTALMKLGPAGLSNLIYDVYSWATLPPTERSVAAVKDRLNYFFTTCFETGQYPTVEKMQLAIGHPREWCVKDGYNDAETLAIREELVKARTIMAGLDAELSAAGVVDRTTYIFRAKNFYAMSDSVTVTPEVTTNPLEGKTFDDLKSRYVDQSVIEAEYAAKDVHSDSDDSNLDDYDF